MHYTSISDLSSFILWQLGETLGRLVSLFSSTYML